VSLLLEVIVQSVADAEEAEAGGADRLEVVREIERDGLTPSLDLVRALIDSTSLPLRVMVRESDGFGIGGPRELVALQRAFADFAELGVHGAVVGFASDGALDLDAIASVLGVAPGLPVTLHRAFDSVGDPEAAIDAMRAFPQVDRILTSGGSGDWSSRCERLAAWARRAGPRITMLPGGGVDDTALSVLARCPDISEAHVGKAAREPAHSSAPVSAARVRRLKALL
jgi:copper homeostasis protein